MKIVGITACIAGIAHTYMAAANLKKFAKKENYEIKIETQGAMGIENELTQAEIDEADVVIFAVDTTVQNEDRFVGKKILEVGTSKVVKDGKSTIEDAIKLARGE
ncbi:MAG: PTS fructose transporter subunit IIB [Liquorilactobacillus hordei]|uniref:Fructose-like phosphotransferase enzyme IIB component 2 n=2 Tax=Liquorilactobacillus hordei TaxID=468911 RepID=A0A0R1MJK7_9LACO|nr:PTS fructose transporter subunit IIB [Liquorilactobacillus hordei]AUJ29106.1 PTS fructose transporter subunit IIB [Liquorilactobacillus hordei]KRL08110.1 fructose-like phosphotransferase enzyme IIB component 2 [Liquorilactobacillus hordei DSM 19519]MBZ2406519.1 PTS fructose transporter subunit IIB [Liquorilactobacillus hordei]QYH51810.1 PTS fructose transporter subunit IIB [Liquorilactobacillus hordei DSM 19519]